MRNKLLLAITFAFLFCLSGTASAAEQIKKATFVVLFTAHTDDKFEEFEDLLDAAKLGVEQAALDSKAKLNIKFVSVDDRADPEHALKALKKVVDEEKPAVILGPMYSSVAMALKGYINEVKIPMISIFATHNDLTKDSQYIFRICASNRRLVKSMADFLVPEAKKKDLSITVFKDLNDDYSTDLADNFRLFTKGSIPNYNEIIFKGSAGIERLKDLNTKLWKPTKKDILFVPTRDVVASRIISSMETDPYLVAAIDSVNFLNTTQKMKSQKSHIRLVNTMQWMPQKSPFSIKVEDLYRKRYKRSMTIASALTFDAAYTAAQALARSTDKNGSLRDALKDSTKLSGVTGLIMLGPDGERVFTDQFLKEEIIE